MDEFSDKLREQLYTRMCEKRAGRIWLEPKPKAKSEGRPSPDRADAFVLSLCGLTVQDFMLTDKATVDAEKDTVTIPRGQGLAFNNQEELGAYIDDLAYEGKELDQTNPKRGQGRRAHGSLASVLPATRTKSPRFSYN